MGNHGTAAVTVVRDATLVAAEDGQLNTLETHEPLPNVIVHAGVDGSPLGVPEEFIQGIISSPLANFVGVVVQLLGLVNSVVDRAVSRVLRWSSVKAGRCASWVLLTVACIWAKGTITRVISARCTGKRLQVSDYYVAQVRIERRRGTWVT